MSETPLAQLACPVCNAMLASDEKTLRCENNHSFDRAKQGYWNLLLVQRKRSKDPGDNPEMVDARTQFLDKQHYRPLAEHVCNEVKAVLNDIAQPKLLDMGCGEGYYTAQLADAVPHAALIGLDISKHAIKAACRRSKSITWLVASGAQMPIPEHSQDMLTVMFSRLMPEAFANALKPNGHLLLVWPAQEHLIELRRTIYNEIKQSDFDPIADLSQHFSLLKQDTLLFNFTLNSKEEVQALLDMTPHSQRMPHDKQAALLSSVPFKLTFHVNVALLQRL
jgi:23S rRNA (guanine745-N1)-methyltransferase